MQFSESLYNFQNCGYSRKIQYSTPHELIQITLFWRKINVTIYKLRSFGVKFLDENGAGVIIWQISGLHAVEFSFVSPIVIVHNLFNFLWWFLCFGRF